MLPLLFPWILLVLLVVAILLSFWKKWIASGLLLVLIFIINWWAECIPLRLWSLRSTEDEKCIKVMSLNIDVANGDYGSRMSELVQLMIHYSPDIIFVSEISDKSRPFIDSLMITEYPYYTFSVNYWHCFYSKYPLSECTKLEKTDGKGVGVYQCKAEIGNDTLVLYGCHFASNNFSADNKYITPDSIHSHQDLKQYLSDIQYAYSVREKEAEIVFEDISRRAHPVIVMGDMNDVGGSASIRTLEDAGLKDAWWEGGFGYGATIHRPLPYRIDHIMYSVELKLKEIKVIDSEGLSDHDALFARFVY